MGYKGIERRKFSRLSRPIPVQFCLVPLQKGGSRSVPVNGRTRDVSPKGLCLETNTVIVGRVHVLGEAMGEENRLSLTIEIPEEDHPLEAHGTVVWYDLAPDDSDFRFRTGVLFTEVEQEVRKKWQAFLSAIKKRRVL
jgi:hypothetical protein